MPASQPPASPVRVLMAVPQYPYPVMGGLERQSHELAKALVAQGVRVQALSGRILPDQPRQETVEGVLVHRIPWPRHKLLRFIRTPFDLLAVLYAQRATYDVVHLHQFSWFGAFVILTARVLGKSVLTKLPSVGAHSLPGLANARLGALKLAIFRMTDSVVAMSTESLVELAGIGFPLDSVLRTPNGISVGAQHDRRHADDTDPGPCRVVFVGRLSGEKRLVDLLTAWQKVTATAARPATLELWGGGPDEADLKALCVSLGIADSVVFLGHVEAVRDRLADMDVFVLTSEREGNSNAILEAMAAGLPVVSTRVGGTPMQVGQEGAHFLVEPGDRDALCARLLELIEDATLRERVGRAMRERILLHFDIRRVARTYAAAYGLLAANRRHEIGGIGNPIITPASNGEPGRART